jgi:phenylacetate-CoA ligase
MSEYYDERETRSHDARAAALAKALPAQIANAKAKTRHFAAALDDVEPESITSAAALRDLPVLRKAELIDRQWGDPPFGGLVATETSALARVFQSPGPIYEPEAARPDFWRFGRAMIAAGFERCGGLIHNTFSYHMMPAGFMFDSAGRALGCPVVPAGPGQSEQQIQAMAQLKPRYYTGTPSFLKILLDKAAEQNLTLDSLSHGLVTAEPLPPSLVGEFRERGVEVHQCYGTADLGMVAYETDAREGLVVDEDVIVEIVRPGTNDPVPEGEVGEVVVTTLNPDYPLIRFGTGDMSAVMRGTCPTGRTNMRIRGWMGRADQTAKVRGVFVHPEQVAKVAARHPAVGRARLVLTQANRQDVATLKCEAGGGDADLPQAVEATAREVFGVRVAVEIEAPDSLPNDGKVIADERSFE